MRVALLFLLLSCSFSFVIADDEEWDIFVDEYTSNEDMEDVEEWNVLMEELRNIHDNPININTATVEQLKALPFLSESQIEEIHAYIYLHGAMETLGELRMLYLMDETTLRWMRIFTYAGEEKKDNKKGGKVNHDISTRVDIPLYYRKGYMVKDGYVGNPLYQRVKYNLENKKFSAGVRMEKDGGERYFDYYGAYFMLKDMGKVKKAVIGDYRLSFGEGLVVGMGKWYSKSIPSMKSKNSVSAMKSMDEYNYLRGAAVMLDITNDCNITFFGSYRQMDATLDDKGNVRTIVKGGYHRSKTENNKKNNVSSTLGGINIYWRHKQFYTGITGYLQYFSRSLLPGDEVYRRFYPKGKLFSVLGGNYGWDAYRWSIAGETAFSEEKKGIATLNRLLWKINRKYTLSALQRYYSKEYFSHLEGAFAESSYASNENGAMINVNANPMNGLTCKCYVDFFYNYWPRYRINHSSSGQECMMEIDYKHNETHRLEARYSMKRKDESQGTKVHHRLKLKWHTFFSSKYSMHTVGMMHTVGDNKGWGIQEYAHLSPFVKKIKLSGVVSYFHTDTFDSRISMYEPSLYNTVSFMQFYGHGIRSALIARWTSGKDKLMTEIKYSVCRYFDRHTQSSSLQTIYSAWKNDISIQMRVKI